MNLLLDVGNTRVKWAEWRDGVLGVGQALTHEAFFRRLAGEGLGLSGAPETIRVACVGGDALRLAFDEALTRCWGRGGDWAVATACGGGVRSAYAEPERLGVDRWLAMLAAYRRAGRALLVVDAGSALTVDALASDGGHRGGVIVPGLAMARQALFAGTGRVRFPIERECLPSSGGELGRNTEEAVKFGTLWSAISLVRYLFEANGAPGEAPAACYLSGGDAVQLSPYLGLPHQLCPDLVLEGLCLQAGWELRL